MTIPVPERQWATLASEAKRERLLQAAADVFAREGLDASMPAVAMAAGAGVASVYRQFPSKYELLAALVVRRLDQFAQVAEEAIAQPGTRWSALTKLLWRVVEQQTGDDFLVDALLITAEHPDVSEGERRALALLDELLASARHEGRLRSDATTADLRLVLAATRAARRVDPEAWRRMLELLIDALDRDQPTASD
jgi:AcrR family transcriptional regulator